MKLLYEFDTLKVPEGVKVEIKSRKVTVKGKHGELVREFRHLPVELEIIQGGAKVKIGMWFSTSKQKAGIRSCMGHINNMFLGVMHKFEYKLRLVYSHFPINPTITGSTVEIRNYLGEKAVRKIDMMPGVKIEKSTGVKDELVLTGTNIDNVSRCAALIHQSTLTKKKDIRKFLDGIYVSEKGSM